MFNDNETLEGQNNVPWVEEEIPNMPTRRIWCIPGIIPLSIHRQNQQGWNPA